MHLERKPGDRGVAQEILVKIVEIGVQRGGRDRGIRLPLLVDVVLDVDDSVNASRPAWRLLGLQESAADVAPPRIVRITGAAGQQRPARAVPAAPALAGQV